MIFVIFKNSNGLMSRIAQRTKGEAFSAAITDRRLYDSEGGSGHPQHAAFGTAVDRGTDRLWSGTLGGSYR